MSGLIAVAIVVAGVGFLGALVWKLYQLYRAPYHLPTWAVTGTLGASLLGYLFQAPAVHRFVDDTLGRGWANLVENALLMAGSCALMLFFLLSAGADRLGARVVRELVLMIVAVAVIAACTFLTPEPARGLNLGEADARIPGVAGFYFFGGLYLIYALARALRWVRGYAVDAEPRLRRGLLFAAIGLGGMVLGSVGRAVVVVCRFFGTGPLIPLNAVASTLVGVGVLAFLLGVTYPGLRTRIVALKLWRRRRRAYHELAPLWLALHDVFPQTALDRTPAGTLPEWLRLRHVHRRYYRRVIEIRDGLVQISPYLPERPADAEDTGQVAQAAALREALRAKAAGEATSKRAKLVANPAGSGIDADMDTLLTLSRGLAV